MSKNKGDFLFCVKAMSIVFRAKFVKNLRKEKAELSKSVYDSLFKKEWVVYAKKAFVKPEYVIEYLGRYSHKIAISNHRILAIDDKKGTVTFSLKSYKKDGRKEQMTLSQTAFIKRFSLHILPKGFTRIRHYGILSGTWKKRNLAALQAQLNEGKAVSKTTKSRTKHLKCPICKVGNLHTIMLFSKTRPPPQNILKQLAAQKQNRHKIKIAK